MLQRLKQFQVLVPFRKQLYFKWRSLRNVPFRNKFFVGYDLDGNTYWEFSLDKSVATRPRRIFEPRISQVNIHSYFEMIPIQWVQWLRYSRKYHPSLEDLAKEEVRVEQLRALSAFRNEEQKWNREMADQRIEENLQRELHRLNTPTPDQTQVNEDPWKEAENKDQEEKQIPTEIKPTKRG